MNARTTLRRRALLGVAVSIAMLLTACGTAATPSPTPKPSATLPNIPPPQPSPSVTGQVSPTTAGPTVTPWHTPTPTPYPIVMCTPPACASGEVYYCPGDCPGGCGTECATPTPGPTPGQVEALLTGPLLIDSGRGRLYASGWTDVSGSASGMPPTHTFVLSAADASVLAVFGDTGGLALDTRHNWLIVDKGNDGLFVLNAETGQGVRRITLPPLPEFQGSPAPVYDPATGSVLAFRENSVYMVNPETGEVTQTIPFDVRKDGGSCATNEGPLPIDRVAYDPDQRLLYAAFLTYTCTPWFGYAIVEYDMAAGKEIGRSGMLPFAATAHDGRLYGSSWYRFGIGYRWIWQDGGTLFQSSDWGGGGLSGFQVDAGRGRLYEASQWDFRAYDIDTLALLFSVPKPAPGSLVGYDPATDNLYLLSPEGKLAAVPVSSVSLPQPEAPAPFMPPSKVVRTLLVSPDWPQDHSIFGVWGYESLTDGCYVFNEMGGLPLVSADGGATWSQYVGGLRGGCGYASALAFSPGYPTDPTLFAGIVGLGLFKSTDNGRLWEPASEGMADMGVREILASPGFETDRTLFVRTQGAEGGAIYRSTDGARTWTGLGEFYGLAMSPEFDQDHTLMAVGRVDQGNDLRVSHDSGDTWDSLGGPPDGGRPVLVSMAPLFSKWGIVHVLTDQGNLYRASVIDSHWQTVLQTMPSAQWAQMAYGSTEVNRRVFLLVVALQTPGDPASAQGVLYDSRDGALTWLTAALPEGASPTAFAMSPAFGQDGTLVIGTADGRVLQVQP